MTGNISLENKDLRSLPSVTLVLNNPTISGLINKHGHEVITYATRKVIKRLRDSVLDGRKTFTMEVIISDIEDLVSCISGQSLKPVINATGVVLHTNLGRAPLGQEVINDISQVAKGYSNLEYDLKHACRSNRDKHVVEILKFLTSAEDAVVVNNNAAGIVLALNTLARDREVIISRGELIEIGGSFRIPEIIEASGVHMVEVGTTNKTRLSDYEEAITPRTALLFKAHRSNFTITGFTEEVSVKELARLAHTHNLPMVYDIGSGLLWKSRGMVLKNEPDVRSAIASGADIVTFSCDKLLGGPQAGIAAGKGSLISRLSRSPLMRAVRVGKLTLAALSSVCRQYLADKKLSSSCPTFTILDRSQEELKSIASKLLEELAGLEISARLNESEGQCGGGTLPAVRLKSVAVEVMLQNRKGEHKLSFAEQFFKRLLSLERPIVGVLREGKVLFDVLTVFKEDIEYIAHSISESIKSLG